MTPKSVLIIASDHETRVKIRSRLERDGHYVTSVISGADAISLLDKITPPSLIILAPDLFIMSSDEFVQFVRRMKGYEKVPISQVGLSYRIAGTCCTTDPDNPESIAEWLKTDQVDPSWSMPTES